MNSLLTVNLVSVNEISESLYLNNLKVIAIIVVSTGSSKEVGLSSTKLTAIYTAVSLTVYNSIHRLAVCIVRSLLCHVHIQKSEETLVGRIYFLKSLSYCRNLIPRYKKTGMVRRNFGKRYACRMPRSLTNTSNGISWSSKAISIGVIFNFIFKNIIDILKALCSVILCGISEHRGCLVHFVSAIKRVLSCIFGT